MQFTVGQIKQAANNVPKNDRVENRVWLYDIAVQLYALHGGSWLNIWSAFVNAVHAAHTAGEIVLRRCDMPQCYDSELVKHSTIMRLNASFQWMEV